MSFLLWATYNIAKNVLDREKWFKIYVTAVHLKCINLQLPFLINILFNKVAFQKNEAIYCVCVTRGPVKASNSCC